MLTIKVTTYYPGDDDGNGEGHREPLAEVGLSSDHGVLITLPLAPGPDPPRALVVVERRQRGWMLNIIPNEKGDEEGYLQIHDDGRVCLMRDRFSALQCPVPGEDGLDLD